MTKKRSKPKPAPKPKPTPEPEPPDEPACRACGCTDSNGCAGGCYWVLDDLCSECAVTLHVTPDEYRLLRSALEALNLRRRKPVGIVPALLARLPDDPSMLPMWQAEP